MVSSLFANNFHFRNSQTVLSTTGRCCFDSGKALLDNIDKSPVPWKKMQLPLFHESEMENSLVGNNEHQYWCAKNKHSRQVLFVVKVMSDVSKQDC